jgi:hypothetical protein
MNLPTNCYYCERPFAKEWLVEDWKKNKSKPLIRTKDHIIPVSHGGINRKANYVYCCIDCNTLKADRTPDQFAKYLSALIDKLVKKYGNRHRTGRLHTILANTEKLIFTIAPYREALIKGYKGPNILPKDPNPPKVKIHKLPPEKVIPTLADEWQKQFQERHLKEPDPDFHEK